MAFFLRIFSNFFSWTGERLSLQFAKTALAHSLGAALSKQAGDMVAGFEAVAGLGPSSDDSACGFGAWPQCSESRQEQARPERWIFFCFGAQLVCGR